MIYSSRCMELVSALILILAHVFYAFRLNDVNCTTSPCRNSLGVFGLEENINKIGIFPVLGVNIIMSANLHAGQNYNIKQAISPLKWRNNFDTRIWEEPNESRSHS
jgi:hypothetical protein